MRTRRSEASPSWARVRSGAPATASLGSLTTVGEGVVGRRRGGGQRERGDAARHEGCGARGEMPRRPACAGS